jgi:pyrimidine-nucleoside phosphorylase
MLHLGEKVQAVEEGRALAEQLLANGSAYLKFLELVQAQGGDVKAVEQPERLPHASIVRTVKADRAGCVHHVNALEIGLTSVDLGAGRARKGDPIDYAVGLLLHAKVADRVEVGQILFTIHANDQAKAEAAEERLRRAIVIGAEAVEPLPLVYGVVS